MSMSKRVRPSYMSPEERERADLSVAKRASIDEAPIDEQRREVKMQEHSALFDHQVQEMVNAIAAAKELQPANQGELDLRASWQLATCASG